MKLKLLLLTALLIGNYSLGMAQATPSSETETVSEQEDIYLLHPYVRNHGFTVEFFGAMAVGSYNYEQPILKRSNYFINAKVGAGSFVGPVFPHSISWNFGKKHHYFELGYQGTVGWTLDIFEDEGWMFGYIPSPIMGYRYYHKTGYFKVYGTAFYGGQYASPMFFPWGGVGFGWYFKEVRKKDLARKEARRKRKAERNKR